MKKATLMGVKHLEDTGMNDPIRLEYYFLKEYRGAVKERQKPLCGVKIVKKWQEDGNASQELESAPAISHSEEFVKQMIRILMQNDVTPVHMLEIVDEMITREEERRWERGHTAVS